MHMILHGSRSRLYLIDNDDEDDDDDVLDDDEDDNDDDYSCTSVNFQDRTSRFCMEVYLDNTYDLLMIMTIMMMMMTIMTRIIMIMMIMTIMIIMMIIAITHDDDDDYRCNSVNFFARTSTFCMEVDLDKSCILMILVMMIIIAVIQSIFKLGPPDIA